MPLATTPNFPEYPSAHACHSTAVVAALKAFFGTDFPMMTPERWLSEFAQLPLKDSVRPKILLHNAAKFLGIDVASD